MILHAKRERRGAGDERRGGREGRGAHLRAPLDLVQITRIFTSVTLSLSRLDTFVCLHTYSTASTRLRL